MTYKNLNSCKKSQIAAGLSWFIGFIIIFFILVMFSSFSIYLKSEKIVTGEENKISLGQTDVDFIRSEMLIAILDTPINDKEKTIRDILLESVDPYLEYERRINGKTPLEQLKHISLGDDINDLYRGLPGYPHSNELIVNMNTFYDNREGKEAKEKERVLRKEIKKVLGKVCEDYLVKIPQGFISENTKGFISENTQGFSTKWYDIKDNKQLRDRWKPWVEIEIPYKGHEIRIKYTMLKKC